MTTTSIVPGSQADIVRLRNLHGPTPVRLHHRPRWFTSKLQQWVKAAGGRSTTASSVLDDFKIAFENVTGFHWLVDHHGSSENGQVFVNEPYSSSARDQVEINRLVAEALKLEFVESTNSFWYPGYTLRFEFRLPQSN